MLKTKIGNFLGAVAIAALITSVSSAQLFITEVMSSSEPTGDWWELTNAGDVGVDLEGYYWDDNGPSGNDGAEFPEFTIQAGESIVIADEDLFSILDFRTEWGESFRVLTPDQFGGPDNFSGLSGNGDMIELWDADPNGPKLEGGVNLVASVVFGSATQGTSFEWANNGASLGLSVSGENGAYDSASFDMGSPGISVVPEPASFALFLSALAAFGFLRRP